jgi:hypothetical protein
MADEAFNPTQFAIESLIAAGAHEQAAKLALKVSKQAQTAPVAPASTAPDPNRLIDYKTLRGMTIQEMTDLQIEEPKVVQRSLEALRAGGEKHNRDSNQGA